MNNIRNIALATVQYEDRLRRLPGLFDPIQGERMASNSGYPNTTWPVTMLPDLERAQIVTPNAAGVLGGVYVEVYVCPSDGTKQRQGSDMSYVANGGKVGSVVFEKLANGPFVNHIFHPKLTFQDGNWMDGRDYTLLYSENIDCQSYDEIGWNGWVNVDKWEFDIPRFVEPDHDDRTWSPVFLWTTAPGDDVKLINQPGPEESEIDCDHKRPGRYTSGSCNGKNGVLRTMKARPSSAHGGGVNVAFGSGRVMFLRENIQYGIYIALMTPYDKKWDSPDPNYVLGDADLK